MSTSADLPDGDDGRDGRRVLWLALGAIALLAVLAAILVPTLSGDDEEPATASGDAVTQEDPGVAEPQGPVGGDAVPPTEEDPGVAEPQGPVGGDPETGGDTGVDGELTAGGTSLLPQLGGRFGQNVGEEATGRGLVVQDVVAERGFFVGFQGGPESEQVYVELGGEAGVDAMPSEGDRVRLSGPIRPAPEDPEQTLGLSQAQAAAVATQRAYIDAESVRVTR